MERYKDGKRTRCTLNREMLRKREKSLNDSSKTATVVVGGSECTSLSTSSFNRQHRVGGKNRISLGDLKVLCSFAGKCNNYETTAIVMAIWLSRGAAGIVAEEYVERAFKDEANEQLQR